MLSERRRVEWLVGRVLLRQCLAHYTGRSAGSLQFDRTAAGKPTLADAPAFNLSHGSRWIVCAVAQASDLGVDIDSSARRNRIDDISERYFHPLEQAALAQCESDTLRRQQFFTRWTLKEAWIKARGETLNGASLHDIAFSLDGASIRAGFDLPAEQRWQFCHWQFDGDQHLALACCWPSCETVADTATRCRFWLWQPEQGACCELATFPVIPAA